MRILDWLCWRWFCYSYRYCHRHAIKLLSIPDDEWCGECLAEYARQRRIREAAVLGAKKGLK